MLWQLILIVSILFMIYNFISRRRLRASAKQLACVDAPYIPLVGHAYLFGFTDESRMKFFFKLGKNSVENGGIVYMWFSYRLFVIIADPINFDILSRSCLQKSELMNVIREFTGNGLVFADVPIWRPRRKFMVPIFHIKTLNLFVQVFSKQSKVLVEKLNKVCGKGDVAIWRYVNSYAMDSVCETNFGVQVGCQSGKSSSFLNAFDEASQTVAARLCQPWLQIDFIYSLSSTHNVMQEKKKILYNFIDEIIEKKRKEIKAEEQENMNNNCQPEKPAKFKSFLDMLIENSGGTNGYTNVELREETFVIMVAGTDTSAVGSCFTLKMLAKHPDVQDKVIDELQDVLGDFNRDITHEDLPKLKYLDAVVKETLRLYPPVPVIVRKVEKDVKLSTGATLIPGTDVMLHIWALHRNPEYWGDDAEYFRPERFIDLQLKHPGAFVPFSTGPRNCIGYQYAMMSMKTAVATLVKSFHIRPSSTHVASKGPEYDPVKFDIMMKSTDGFSVQLEKRLP